MAKLAFTKLGLKVNQETYVISWNEQEIEVKAYLPISDKLDLMTNVINKTSASDNNSFLNPIKVSVFTTLEIVSYYTNINFTEKQKEDPAKLYDLLVSSGLYSKIKNAIPSQEYELLLEAIDKLIKSTYEYQSSVLGILETLKEDYSQLDLNATNIQEKLADPNNLDLLRDILTKLG